MKKIKATMKDMQCIRNRKTIVVAIVIVLAFIICVVANYHKAEVYSLTNTYYANSNQISIDVKSGDVIEQEFILQEGDDGIAVLFATYMSGVTKGTVNVEVCDENRSVISSFSVPATNIKDNQFCRFMFKDCATELVNKKSVLRLTFLGIEEQPIALYASQSDELGCSYKINGIEQTHEMVIKGVRSGSAWQFKDVRWFYVFAFVLLIACFVVKLSREDVKNKVGKINNWTIGNRKNIFHIVLTTAICGIVSLFCEFIWSRLSHGWNPYRWIMVLVFLLIIGITIVFKNYIWKCAHVYFFVLVMLIGSFMIMSVPVANLSYDEHIHYMKSAYLSWGANGTISEADYAVYVDYTSYYSSMVSQKENRISIIDKFNTQSYEEQINFEDPVALSVIAYTPAAIALYIGRTLHFDFYSIYVLGKLANLTCYAGLIAYAIRCLQGKGKIIATAIGLIPTSIFQAVSYSYDWWINALVILGVAIFIGEIQKNGKIKNSKLCLSIIIIILGLLPKPVYFPMLLVLALLHKECYEDKRMARGIVICGMIVLLLSFVLPMLLSSGTGFEDVRGGEGVDSIGQIKFILSDILGYVRILLAFLWGYFAPDNVGQYLTNWAYLGSAGNTTLCVIAITISAIIDNEENITFSKKMPWLKVGNIVGIFAAMVLVATSMYVAFTPVGHTTINGCQLRYILPILFPLMFFTGENTVKINDSLKQKGFIFVSLAMVWVTINGWYNLIVVTY